MGKKKKKQRAKTRTPSLNNRDQPVIYFGDLDTHASDALTKALGETVRALLDIMGQEDPRIRQDWFWGRAVVQNIGITFGIRFYFGPKEEMPQDGNGRIGVIYNGINIAQMQKLVLTLLKQTAVAGNDETDSVEQ